MSRVIMMYSFKGGAGRTVSTANVAAILAKEFGRRVVLLDLDVESAGTSVLFNLQTATRKGTLWTVQDILRGYYEPTPEAEVNGGAQKRTTIDTNRTDFEAKVWPKIHHKVNTGSTAGYLKILPAKTIIHNIDETRGFSDESQKHFDNLLRNLENLTEPPDIVLLDSASGLQETAHLGLMKCHALVIFFRWTRQFTFGTTRFLSEYICQNPRVIRRIKKVFLVPTAVPRSGPSEHIAAEHRKRRNTLLEDVHGTNRYMLQRNPNMPEHWTEVHAEIFENDSMKWEEQVLVLNKEARATDADLLQDYRALASTLNGLVNVQ